MKLLVSGGTGLVGAALVPRLRSAGHDVRRLARGTQASAPDTWWNVETGDIDHTELERWNGPEGVVHLAGENIAAMRWSPEQKRRIRNSRVEATERLCASLLELGQRLSVFISASAVGYYGNRGDEKLTEASAPGSGFLPEVTVEWEESSSALREAGVRVVHLRFGMILDHGGGALAKMLPMFRAGLGGPIGQGRQWVSWVSLVDVLRVIEFALTNPGIKGPYNVAAPEPVTNRQFAKALGSVLHRPAFMRAPALVLRVAFGEMADALLLSSARVLPQRLQEAGFVFEHASIDAALHAAVG